MKKIILVLAAVGLVFVFYLLKVVWGGFLSTAEPNVQIEKAKCVASCRNGNLSNDCDGYCVSKTVESIPNAKGCLYNGMTYKSGDGFKSDDGCNSCSCVDGQVACTLMACER